MSNLNILGKPDGNGLEQVCGFLVAFNIAFLVEWFRDDGYTADINRHLGLFRYKVNVHRAAQVRSLV